MTTNEQILGQLSKREVAFRIKSDCFSCVFWGPDEYGHYKCGEPETEETCRAGFEEWMRKEIDE